MLYSLEQGETAEFLTKMAIRLGQPIPDRIANAPALLHGLDVYLNAFHELDSERMNTGMSIGRIPWSKCILYADINDFDERQTRALVAHVRRLDTIYIQHFMKKD